MAALALALAGLLAPAPLLAAKALLYAGSYTTSGVSKGIYAWRFDSKDGSLAPLGLMAATPQPAHIWIAPNGRTLYAVNWEQQGGVSAFHIDPATGALRFLDRVSAEGALPNQVVIDPSGRIAISVTYATGNVAAYKVQADGRLSDAFYVDQHHGDGQGAKPPVPRTHGIQFSPDGRHLYIADLGLDRIYAYRVDAARGRIVPANPAFVTVHAGAGPRRLQMSSNGRFLYANHETDSEVSVFAVDGEHLRDVQTISTVPPGFSAKNMTAEIILSADDRHLYVSNRGHDSIAAFDVGADGRLALHEIVPAGGKTPRNLRLDPTGTYLFCANENGGTITLFKVDKSSGSLTRTATTASIETPGGLYFAKSR